MFLWIRFFSNFCDVSNFCFLENIYLIKTHGGLRWDYTQRNEEVTVGIEKGAAEHGNV
jgi:hypothetical protein